MNRFFYFLIIFVILLGLGADWVIKKANRSHNIPVLKPVPEFSFLNHRGERFSEKELRNKITVLDFMFTSCTGPCPLMTSNMLSLYNDFTGVKDVQFISITVDPIIDTQDQLKEYAKIIGVSDNRWHFLRSDIEAVKVLKRDGFMLFADDLPQGHAIKFILIDQNGNIRKYFDGTDIGSNDVLKKDIVKLVNEYRS